MNRILPILFCVVGAIDGAAGATTGVSSLAALGANDSADWSQLGPAFAAVSSPFTAASLSGLTLTGSGTGLERRDEGFGWIGDFNANDALLWNGGSGAPITIDFNRPVRGVGAQIQGDIIGPFTVTITAYQNATVLGSFSITGSTMLVEDGSAPFLGILSSSANITRVVFSEADSTGVDEFAMDRLNIAATAPPVIVSRFPAAGATGVTSSEVDVTFNRPMNPATLNSSTFTLRAAGATSNAAASVFVSGATASLIPSCELTAGTTYTVTLAATVADTSGVPLGTPVTWTFTTAGSSAPPPIIISRFPAAGAIGAARAGEVDVTFDRAMNAATLNSSSFTLRAAGATSNVAASIYVSGAAASLIPSSPLAAGTTYTATLAATVADTNGVALGTAATWTFTTAGSSTPPVIVSRFPAAGATGVTGAGEVDVTFDRAMNAATLNSSTFTLRAAGAASNVAATIYASGAAASLVPSAALAASTTYTVTLAATVADTNGVTLGTPVTWTFTTH